MDINERLRLIKRNTDEIVTENELKDLLKIKKRPSVYLGTAITGRPHIGYFMFVIKLSDLIKAGFKVKILLADIHGALDNCPWDTLEKRFQYYKKIIPLMFKAVGMDVSNLEFVKGSDFQLSKDYVFDVLRMSTFTSINDCKRAAAEVVKFGDNPKLSGLIYPIMQALDEVYLGVDIQYGGVDQRKILMFARENLPKIGYRRQIELMTPMLPGLSGGKMSASDEKSKIDLLDSEKTIYEKFKKAFCPAGEIENNGVLAFAKYIIFVLKEDKNEEFVVERDKKFGGNLSYKNYKELERDFVNKKLHPLDLKKAVAREVNQLLEIIRKNFKDNKLVKEAYWKIF
jgi:tyrosyl-tRNA synthetase